MNILDRIIAHKKQEVAQRKSQVPVSLLEKSPYFNRQRLSFKGQLSDSRQTGIIAEFKRKSPSKGIINDQADVADTTAGYVGAGASALSVLTDTEFFGGSTEDLTKARKGVACPILRKDFTIDEYQILEAKAMGADLILLIAAALTPEQVRALGKFAQSMGLEVLLEVHNREELEQTVCPYVDAIGVNNRNLKDFTVNVNLSKELARLIPGEFIKVSESGISDPATVVELRKYGYHGFLMGENFMKHPDPAKACNVFVGQLRQAMEG